MTLVSEQSTYALLLELRYGFVRSDTKIADWHQDPSKFKSYSPPLFTNGREARRREAASALDSEC